jgi:hypothetical protein
VSSGETVVPNKVALLAVTFGRPMAIQRLIRTARGRYPHLSIYVADQSEPDPFMDEFYEENRVNIVRTGPDSGVAFSRNRLLEEIEEDYVLVSDDDVIFLPETSLEVPLQILEARPDLGVVGGRLWNVETHKGEVLRDNLFWELLFLEDHQHSTLTTAPVHLFPREPQTVAGERIFLSDSVLNFALFRRSCFSETIRWDPQFKSNGEHEDFYVNWKHNGRLKIAYSPGFVAEHHRPSRQAYERNRERVLGWDQFMRKWGFTHHLELGYGLRLAADTRMFATMDDLGFDPADLRATSEARVAYYFGNRESANEKRLRVLRQEPDPPSKDETPVELITIFGAYRREHVVGTDFTLFLRPESPSHKKGEAMSREILYSWRLGDFYLVFNASLSLYGTSPVWSEWSAFDIPIPEIDGVVLTLDVLIPGDPASQKPSSTRATVVCSSRDRLSRTNEWVYSLTPAREGSRIDETPPTRWRRELADVFRGVRVEMLTLEYTELNSSSPEPSRYEVPPHAGEAVRALASGVDLVTAVTREENST